MEDEESSRRALEALPEKSSGPRTDFQQFDCPQLMQDSQHRLEEPQCTADPSGSYNALVARLADTYVAASMHQFGAGSIIVRVHDLDNLRRQLRDAGITKSPSSGALVRVAADVRFDLAQEIPGVDGFRPLCVSPPRSAVSIGS
eukprot:scaffold2324_cov266-Pinguiococcus_pyrenoidosus.AAC.20